MRSHASANRCKEAGQFKWKVLSADSGAETVSGGLNELVKAITGGIVKPDDTCITHDFAPAKKLREACDEHFELRKLYDPMGAWTRRVGNVVGVIFCVLYIIGSVISGLMITGETYLLEAIFGILAVVLTLTIIGLIIMIVIANNFGIPLLGAYIGVILFGLTSFLVYCIGTGLGRGSMWVVGKIAGLERRRAVSWD